MRLCLGTVQFGLDYGIIGQKKPALDDSINCIDYATQNGISALDTATAYGTAEEVTGVFLAKRTIAREKLFVSSKMLPNILDDYQPKQYYTVIKEHLVQSLRTLHTDYLDAYMLHSARYAHRPEILEALQHMQTEGLARKVGVSVYDPDEALACYQSPYVDIVQLPYSIFDHRMKNTGMLEATAMCGTEVHTRSAFIQGLILLEEGAVPPFLSEARPIVAKINQICSRYSLNRVALAMAYVKRETAVTHLVFGVDNLLQLKQDILLFQTELPQDLLKEIGKEFENIKAEVVMPSLWKK